MLIKTYAAAPVGIEAELVTIEVHATPGYDFTLVGLADSAVKEGHERIMSALTVCGWMLPQRNMTINMSPADLKKAGSSYDLPLAISMLAATEKVHVQHLSEYIVMGELSLDGSLRPVHGILPMALLARKSGFKGIILPERNAAEAAVVEGVDVYGFEHLADVVNFLNDQLIASPLVIAASDILEDLAFTGELDFSEVRGQHQIRRAIEVAAAGGHNLLMVGVPGSGKSMMAKRIPTILPPMTLDEALETTKIYSVSGLMNHAKDLPLIVQRPFRSPHHTISDVGLSGGGSNPRPGEISLAHHGVLFLDELPEFHRSALEVLRQPLEDRKISVVRQRLSVEYPASFMLVAAMNPCPCGHLGDPVHPCTCTPAQRHRYLSKISGPLLDRIDIQCEIQAVGYDELKGGADGEPSVHIRERVIRARAIQQERFSRSKLVHCNAEMNARMVRSYCVLDEECDRMLKFAMNKFGLSARAYDRILKVARTVADLAESENIRPTDIAEAISYRTLDRQEWGG